MFVTDTAVTVDRSNIQLHQMKRLETMQIVQTPELYNLLLSFHVGSFKASDFN